MLREIPVLTADETQRYDRQIIINGFGEAGQEKLKRASVVIAGSGGLGLPAAVYLVAAGVGKLRIIDHDKVELSNLNRQILHWDKDLGQKKVESAGEKLSQMNGNVTIEMVGETIDESNVVKLTDGFNVIIDAMDNMETRFLLNKAAIKHSTLFVHGAVYGLEGRAMTIIPGKTACLGCVYRGLPPKEKFPVLGTTPGLIGMIQATEAIKIITGIGELLTNRLLIYDGLKMKFSEVQVKRDSGCKFCGSF